MPSNNVIYLPEPESDLKRQAMSWVVRLNSGEATRGDRRAFTRWIGQSDEHRRAFFATRHLWREIGHLDAAASGLPEWTEADSGPRTS